MIFRWLVVRRCTFLQCFARAGEPGPRHCHYDRDAGGNYSSTNAATLWKRRKAAESKGGQDGSLWLQGQRACRFTPVPRLLGVWFLSGGP